MVAWLILALLCVVILAVVLGVAHVALWWLLLVALAVLVVALLVRLL